MPCPLGPLSPKLPNATRDDSRPRVCVLLSHYLPGFRAGGPTRSIENLIGRLGHEIAFHIITRDRDLGDTVPYPGVPVDEWFDLGQAKVAYVSPGYDRAWRAACLLKAARPDQIYVNNLFDPFLSCVPLILAGMTPTSGIPVVVAPHGIFGAGAMSLKSWKKVPFLATLRTLRFTRRVTWHATCPAEAQDIRRQFGSDAPIVIASNLTPTVPESKARTAKEPGHARLIFLARVVPIKNLLLAIQSLQGVQGHIAFDVCGPIEDKAYWRLCQEHAKHLPENVRLTYRGTLAPDQVIPELAQYDGLLLPSCGENFGYSILESLLAGCPVVISDRTPWRNLPAAGAGWDLSLDDVAGFRTAIQTLVDSSEAEHACMRQRAREFGRSAVREEQNLNEYRRLFRLSLQRAA